MSQANTTKIDCENSSTITKDAQHMPLTIPIAENMDQFVDVVVYTQNKEDCQWGIFDFNNISIDKNSGKFKKLNKQADEQQKQPVDFETWGF